MIEELRIKTPDNKVRRFELTKDSYSLGRAHSNDLCYPDDASLSRKHLLLEQDEQGWTVSDLGSKNGTVLNGTRVTRKSTSVDHPVSAGLDPPDDGSDCDDDSVK